MENSKSRTLYMECASGISGDMAVGALLDLGADREVLDVVLKSLPIAGFETRISRVKKAGLDVCDFAVILDEAHDNHDHDMEYLHGHNHECGHETDCGHNHEHGHGADCGHDHEHGHEADCGHHHHHHHEHRGMTEILHIIEHAEMTSGAKTLAERIFTILARAESKAHGVPETEVHFHEVGAVDSIVDIIAAAVCFDNLGIKECIIPALCEGCGTVRCQHGILPVPVPAVTNIVQDSGLKLTVTDTQGEFVTPTGAAIAAAIQTSDRLPEQFTIQNTGMGGGKRNYERPSILRVMLIDTHGNRTEKDVIWKLETNVDDCTGEALGYALERLTEAGARDVSYLPVYMKKNRPAYQMNVICTEDKIEELEQIIFEETTTIGIRRQRMERSILTRSQEQVPTGIGDAQVKVCIVNGKKRIYPEYDSVSALCKKSGKSFQDVYRLILRKYNENTK